MSFHLVGHSADFSTYSVVDTKDGVRESVSHAELLQYTRSGIEIDGVRYDGRYLDTWISSPLVREIKIDEFKKLPKGSKKQIITGVRIMASEYHAEMVASVRTLIVGYSKEEVAKAFAVPQSRICRVFDFGFCCISPEYEVILSSLNDNYIVSSSFKLECDNGHTGSHVSGYFAAPRFNLCTKDYKYGICADTWIGSTANGIEAYEFVRNIVSRGYLDI